MESIQDNNCSHGESCDEYGSEGSSDCSNAHPGGSDHEQERTDRDSQAPGNMNFEACRTITDLIPKFAVFIDSM